MTTTSSPLARDATGYEIYKGDRVGSFHREVPGTVDQRDGDKVLVLHDGDPDPTPYLVGEISNCVPGLFVLNLEAAA
jgi:hypothetical protein